MGKTDLVKRGECPVCGEPVIWAEIGGPPEAFDPGHARMLVILCFPEVDGKKRVALGPCQDEGRPLHAEGEEPVAYFGHLKHRCAKPKETGGMQ